MKSALLYNLYLVNNWHQVTKELLEYIPQDHLYVNINFDWQFCFQIPKAIFLLKKQKKLKKIFFSTNHASLGEVKGFENFRNNIKFTNYDIATYIHSKGVTKPNNKNVAAWRELMRYFVLEKFENTITQFNIGYNLYGALLHQNIVDDKVAVNEKLKVTHWYRGTFVSTNLNSLRKAFLETPVDNNFYGIESFFGKLCSFNDCYNAFNFSESLYTTFLDKKYYQK